MDPEILAERVKDINEHPLNNSPPQERYVWQDRDIRFDIPLR
jgi:hypothetical protein